MEPEEVNNKYVLNTFFLGGYARTLLKYMLFGKLGPCTEHQEEKLVIKSWWEIGSQTEKENGWQAETDRDRDWLAGRERDRY